MKDIDGGLHPAVDEQSLDKDEDDNYVILIGFCVNTFLTKYMYLSYLPCIRKFGLPYYVSCPVIRNVNDEKYFPLVSVSKQYTSLFGSLERRSHYNKKYLEKSSSHNRHFPLAARNE